MTLLVGGALGLLIPFLNGIVTKNWIWNSITNSHDAFLIDSLWLIIGGLALFYGLKLSKKEQRLVKIN